MKRKMIVGMMVMLLLTSVLSVAFYFVLVVSPAPEEPIKIGVMAPLSWFQGQGIMEGATLAAEEINAAGGVLGRNVTLVFANTTSDPEAPAPILEAVGRAAAEELITAGVDFAIGGFRSEVTMGAREVFMNHTKIFIIAGAVADELIDCGDGTCGACVRCNYTRYKYLFRTSPINLTFCFRQLTSFLATYLLPKKLVPIYGSPVKVAVITDNSTWTEEMHENLTNPAIYTDVLGPHANVTYSTRVRYNATDFTAEMTAIKESGARLIVHMFSSTAGVYFISYWRAAEVEAIPVGINVLSQHSDMWNWTGGGCEYETILAPSGTRTPITNSSIPFWNAYVERFGHDPRQNSWGAYDAIYTLKEAIERAETTDSDAVVAELEQTDRIGTLRKFKFTGTNGTLHDVFCNEIGPTWTQGYSRPFIVQWQAGKMEVIWPADQSYSKEFALLPWMPEPESIKIGVLGPMAWLQGQGMMEGAVLAAEEINATGGILGHPVEIIAADTLRGQPEPTEETGIAAAEELIAAGVDFAVGGFKTEAVFGAREVFMNHSCIYFIAGAATERLVDCGNVYDPDGPLGPTPPGPCNACVRCNYERYKYLFRVAPVNGSTIAKSLWAFHRFVLEDKLLPIYGELLWENASHPQVRVAVISENLPWADTIHLYMTNPAIYPNPAVLGPYANVTYSARPSPLETDFSAYLAAINASGARLIIHSFSEEAGRHFITQWRDMEVKAVPVGINVLSQESNMWDLTGGNCEYETIIAPSGTKTPITNLSIQFWNAYVARWGHDPIYTSHAPYGSIYGLKETIEAYESWPIDPDTMVPLFEQNDRIGTHGRFRYTGPWNATHKGIYHDVFCNEIGPTWTQGYSRPFYVQWKAGRKEVIWPADQPYSKELRLPPWMCIRVPQNYSTIQEAINAAPPGFAICVSPGTYYEHVVVNKSLSLIGADKSNTIIDGNLTGNVVMITANDVDITGFTIKNSGPAPNSGIHVSSSGNNISHNIITNNYYDIFLGHSGGNTVSNNTVTSNSDWGVFLYYSNGNIVSDNTVTSNGEWGITLSWYSTGNTISGNTVTSNSQGGILTVLHSNNNTVSGNEVTLNGITGIQASNYSCCNTISGNTVTSNGMWGIMLSSYSSGNTISGNTVTSNSQNGITAYYSSGNNIFMDNRVSNNSGTGIAIRTSSGNTLRDNNITGNKFSFSVWSELNRVSDYIQDIDTSNIVDGKPIYYWVNQRDKQVPADAGYVHAVNCVNITVEDLNLTKNGPGVRFVNTNDSTIRNVTALDNNVGIHLILSSGNTISGSTITSLGWYRPWSDAFFGSPGWMPGYGIILENSSGNTMRGNTITNNDLGVGLGDSSSNTIYHNNFVNNAVQANVTFGYANTWDDGYYPSGGNYWSDYNGTDLYHGPYQNETGSDGIGDTPYVIGENNTDRYPLVKPYGVQHDIGITSITTSKTIITQCYLLHINIRIVNYGVNAENFTVTVYANITIIQTKIITLTSGNSTTVTFTWNTTGVPYGNYTISATATPVPDETDIVDNTLIDGWVLVTIPGDVNGDCEVDIFDGVLVAAALGARLITDPEDPRFGEYWHDEACPRCPHDPCADVNQDGVVDGLDLEIVEDNYGKTW